MTAPTCQQCNAPARLTDGGEVYPHRPDLHDKPIWRCDRCGGYVGCHPGTIRPLGTPADVGLRQARRLLHAERIDPLWRTADRCGAYRPESEKARRRIRRTARDRVYAFLAEKLGLSIEQTHVGMFDIGTCRRAWKALDRVDYLLIRAWAHDKAQTSARAA